MGNCKSCNGTGRMEMRDSIETCPCPDCDGSSDYIPVREPEGRYYRRTAAQRSGLSYNNIGRYAGDGICEGDYDEESGRPGRRYNSPIYQHDKQPNTLTEGEVSEVKVYDHSSGKLIRIEKHVYEKSKTGKTGKWHKVSEVRY